MPDPDSPPIPPPRAPRRRRKTAPRQRAPRPPDRLRRAADLMHKLLTGSAALVSLLRSLLF